MLRIWPSEFEGREHIIKEERDILRTAKKYIKNGHWVTGINPHGLGTTNNSRMGMYISPSEGLISYSIVSGPIEPSMIDMYIMTVELNENLIYERLIDSKILIARNGNVKKLKFPYKHVLIFHGEDLKKTKCSDAELEKLKPYAVSRFFRPLDKSVKCHTVDDLNIFSYIKKEYDSSFTVLTEEEQIAIFERLAPEYSIIIPEKLSLDVKETKDTVTEEMMMITGEESEFRTFLLDEYQVGIVNEMGKGHRVILANPGAGKSVIMLSKAFKYASLYKDSQILLTCYNSNLADSYRFKRDNADFGDANNLNIMTLHALVLKLFRDDLGIPCSEHIATREDIDNCLKYVKSGKIKVRFKAIFIDEVQIFDPLYLDLCYALLEKSDDVVFLMAGDLNQNVKAQSRRGDAPWKKMETVKLDFTGRVKYIEKNYRNTKQIGAFLNRMLRYMNLRMDEMGMINKREFEYNVFENGNKDIGIEPIIRTKIPRMRITDEIMKAVEELVNKYDCAYSDIAILYPFRQQKSIKYYIQYWIKIELDKRGIDYSFISTAEDPNEIVSYSKASGIIISSIESSLGLDFKAVILTGLYSYNYVFTDGMREGIKSWKAISELSEEQKTDAQKEMRELYTACSRARELLYVISDLDANSPMEDIILSGGTKS